MGLHNGLDAVRSDQHDLIIGVVAVLRLRGDISPSSSRGVLKFFLLEKTLLGVAVDEQEVNGGYGHL